MNEESCKILKNNDSFKVQHFLRKKSMNPAPALPREHQNFLIHVSDYDGVARVLKKLLKNLQSKSDDSEKITLPMVQPNKKPLKRAITHRR